MSAVNNVLQAETYFDSTRPVSLADIKHRVSVYAVIVEHDHILMVKTNNNKWYFPGGGLDVGESLENGVKREVSEELGVEVEVGALLYADDMIYYHDPADKIAQLVRLFYACRPLSREFHFQNAEERDDFLEIGWVPLREIPREDVLPSTWRALNAIKAKVLL